MVFTTEILRPKPGKTLSVSGAAGAVGSLVGQIGKIEGLTVIGSSRNAGKLDFKKEIGFEMLVRLQRKREMRLRPTGPLKNGSPGNRLLFR